MSLEHAFDDSWDLFYTKQRFCSMLLHCLLSEEINVKILTPENTTLHPGTSVNVFPLTNGAQRPVCFRWSSIWRVVIASLNPHWCLVRFVNVSITEWLYVSNVVHYQGLKTQNACCRKKTCSNNTFILFNMFYVLHWLCPTLNGAGQAGKQQ